METKGNQKSMSKLLFKNSNLKFDNESKYLNQLKSNLLMRNIEIKSPLTSKYSSVKITNDISNKKVINQPEKFTSIFINFENSKHIFLI